MKFVKDAGNWWRWFSVQAMGLCAALQGAWVFIPDDLKAHVPAWGFNALCALILVLGVFGRLVKQGGDDA